MHTMASLYKQPSIKINLLALTIHWDSPNTSHMNNTMALGKKYLLYRDNISAKVYQPVYGPL